jgi:hypothetical protein
MNKDNPDTFVMEDQSEWEATQVDDVFLPSVQVQLGWKDVEAAVARGAVVPAQAHALWASWAAPGSPLRRGAGTLERAYESTQTEAPWADDMPKLEPSGGGAMMQAVLLLAAAAVGAGVMYFLGR